jgi:hypothetical protein
MPGYVMPHHEATLTSDQVTAILAYLRSLRLAPIAPP